MNSPLSPEERVTYRVWWETVGRGDLTRCPCGVPAEAWVANGRAVLPAGPGLCPRHRFDLTGGNREQFAQWIIAGEFAERDLTPAEAQWASWAAEGRIGKA